MNHLIVSTEEVGKEDGTNHCYVGNKDGLPGRRYHSDDYEEPLDNERLRRKGKRKGRQRRVARRETRWSLRSYGIYHNTVHVPFTYL